MVYMSIAANQYANKVFSEHPIALWTLDEEVYFLSLISNSQRFFSTWTLTNCTADDNPTLPQLPSPISSDIYSAVIANTTDAVTIEAESPVIFYRNDLDKSISSFCVNFFLYQKAGFINWIKLGYRYLDVLGNPQEVISDEIPPAPAEFWVNFNNTYSYLLANETSPVKLFFQVSLKDTSDSDESARTIIVNGLSVAQGSETTCYENLGSEAFTIGTSNNFSHYGIPADQYGILADNAYYLIEENSLLAKNDGFPIIYGTPQSTKIYHSNLGKPSLIFPGKGMLHESGRNKKYSLELWIKIDPKLNEAKKIIGPVASNDGIYIKEGFITLVVGNEIESYCVSEWYRPMLLNLIISEKYIYLLLNGEEVIKINFYRQKISLPYADDWWGIYSYEGIENFNIDCISIYPYSISNIASKRRFVYGQGTPSIESLDRSFLGTPTSIDFATSEYGPNIIYPDFYRWDAGYFNNLEATRSHVSVPKYSLPEINLGSRNLYEWYEDNLTLNLLENPNATHPNFITFRPNIDTSVNPDVWDPEIKNYTEQSYLNFKSINILNDEVASIYAIFQIQKSISEDRTLMSFVNIINNKKFDININEDVVSYLIDDELIYSENIEVGLEFVVGFALEQISIEYGYKVANFFSSPTSIQLYVGGNGNNTFEGKIYGVWFSNQSNYEPISDNFTNGIVIQDNYEIFLNHLASYTLLPEHQYNKLFLDISISSQWEEYYPLSYFAGYVKDADGNSVYDLDMLQINLGHCFIQTKDYLSYASLRNQYFDQTYQDLKNSDYQSYFNLSKNNQTTQTLAVSKSSIKSYITFQYLYNENILPSELFLYTKELSDNKVIYADEENTEEEIYKAYFTRFAFQDDVVVYPPKIKDFKDFSMVVHLNINQRSILKNPLKIKNFEITSKNFNFVSNTSNENQRNYIGTKFGTKIYPQIVSSGEIDYKSKNPLLIYKASTPYLYTTKKSGIQVVKETLKTSPPQDDKYMISIPINKSGVPNFRVGAIQFSLLGNFIEDSQDILLMDINHENGKYSLILDKTENNNVIRIYKDVDSILTETDDVVFYQNGRYVLNPVIKKNEWNIVSLSFTNQLSFSNYPAGSIDTFGNFLFNNISYYLSEGLGFRSDVVLRTWRDILNYEDIARVWSFWSADSKTWRNVYVFGEKPTYSLTPSDIYDVYTGTNNNIVDDGYGLEITETQSLFITDNYWQLYSGKPA